MMFWFKDDARDTDEARVLHVAITYTYVKTRTRKKN